MINEKTKVLEAPYNLATLSKATGNPILDLGYQCCDMRPYFKYINGNNILYITVHPNNLHSQKVNVYKEGIVIKDGVEYESMSYQGNTSETSINTEESVSTITFKDIVYTWDGTYKDIRGFFINKWASYKPVRYDSEHEITNDIRFGIPINAGITIGWPLEERDVVNLTEEELSIVLDEMLKGNFYWTYYPPIPRIDWCRMTDFESYYSKAKCPFTLTYKEGTSNLWSYKASDGYTDYYLEKNTIFPVEIFVELGELPNLPDYNLSRTKLPMVFKKNEHYGAGIIYQEGGDLKCTNAFDGKSFTSPFVIDEFGNYYSRVYFKALKDKEYIVGGYVQNDKSADQTFLWPVKPLKFRIKEVPPIVKFNYNWTTKGKTLILALTITRNGQEVFWSRVKPDTTVDGVFIGDIAGNSNDYLRFSYIRNTSTGDTTTQQYFTDIAEFRTMGNGSIEWNGWIKASTQEGIYNPIIDITNHLYGIQSQTFYFEFQDGIKATIDDKSYLNYDEIVFEAHIWVYHTNLNTNRQLITIRENAIDIFKEVGWIKD